ncbi:unnamed protein product [Hydatigera taeniaeformis]|uniref:Dzip-like_N domain-containing protein n=1 Tax=Hydatigena taeniaeformis TaxID=6205 RepID=A0A0R3X6C2_HYDTA|nr:unnamed protein product [Hydatigera taeniaeformis]
MSADAHSEHQIQRLLLDLIPPNGDCEVAPKLDVQWSKHLHNKLQALNVDLVSMGFVSYLRTSDPHTAIIDFNVLIAALYELFELYLRCLNAREDADIKIRRLTADLEHSRKMHDRCKDELQSTRDAVHHAKENERRIGAEKVTLANQLRASKEAFRRHQSDSQLHSAHLQRKVNSLEKEVAGLKNRLNALLEKPMVVRRFPSAHETVRSGHPSKMSSQLDRTRNVRNRENDLFYENRELRDLVSVLSTRILRFTRHLCRKRRRHQLLVGTSEAQLEVNEEEEEEEETSLDGESDADTYSDSSVCASMQSQLSDMQCQRRQSANVRHLLLELPFHLVRDQLVCRVHRLCRRLWREIKAVGSFEGALPLSKWTGGLGAVNGEALSTDEVSVEHHLQEQLSRCKLDSAQCEQEWKGDDLLMPPFVSLPPLNEEAVNDDVSLPKNGIADETVIFDNETEPRTSISDCSGKIDEKQSGYIYLKTYGGGLVPYPC